MVILQPREGVAQRFYQNLQEYCTRLSREISSVSAERKDSLLQIGDRILQMQQSKAPAEVMFTGVNNGSLSQLAEIWFYSAIHFYRIKNVKVYSGGIHPGAVGYRIVGTLKRCGFLIMPAGGTADNPVYFLNAGRNFPDYSIFAKAIDYRGNPHDKYLVIPLCPEADSINYRSYGAGAVIPFHWKTPSIWNDTAIESVKYDECTHEIARDIFFLANYIRQQDKIRKKITGKH